MTQIYLLYLCIQFCTSDSMHTYFLACPRGVQDRSVSGAAVCELLDWTGTVNIQATQDVQTRSLVSFNTRCNCFSLLVLQALIAETVESYDTMDLFRHTTELSTHVRVPVHIIKSI